MKRTIKDLVGLKGRTVLLRVDFNVPIDENGKILDNTRLVNALPTIRYLIKQKAKVVLLDINNFTELLKKEVEQKLNKKIEALKNVGDFFEVNEKVGEKRKQIFEIVAKNKNLKIETVTKNKIKILVVTKIN